MNKEEFLRQLRKGLSGLPKDDIDERLAFYSEMIDDRMEDGISEETAVSEIGTVEELVQQIIADIPLGKLVKEKMMPKKKMKVWEIVLLALGSPIWLTLLIAVFAVVFSIYVVLWSVIIVLWAVFAALAVCVPACAAIGVMYCVRGDRLSGFTLIGAGIVCAGLSVLMFFVCRAVTKGILFLTKKLMVWFKNRIVKKEEA